MYTNYFSCLKQIIGKKKKKKLKQVHYVFQKCYCNKIEKKKNRKKKKFCCLYVTLWGQFKKILSPFFCLQLRRANNCSCILLLQLFAVAACVTSMF